MILYISSWSLCIFENLATFKSDFLWFCRSFLGLLSSLSYSYNNYLQFVKLKYMIAFSYEQKLCQIQIFQAYCKLWCFRGICMCFRPTFGSFFFYLPILTTTKWTMNSGQQQNGTKLAYINNGVDKQQKRSKRGLKTLAWSHKKHFQ